MDLQTLKIFAEYNTRTNQRMNEYITALSEAHWRQEFGGYFNSIQSLCNHLYISDFTWLKRFSALREFDYRVNPLFAKDVRFGTVVLNNVAQYAPARKELDVVIEAFVQEIKQDDIEQKLTYIDSHGTEYKRRFGGLVLHMFNHQTHHRGMISIYLEEMNINNDYSNLMDMF